MNCVVILIVFHNVHDKLGTELFFVLRDDHDVLRVKFVINAVWEGFKSNFVTRVMQDYGFAKMES